jgi:hypothetical protein
MPFKRENYRPEDSIVNSLRDGVPAEFYVNVYHVGLRRGGREEGGWHFEMGIPEACFPVTSLRTAERLARRLLTGTYSNEDRREISSVLSDGEYRVHYEINPAEGWPSERPQYE